MIWILIGYMFLFVHRPFEVWPILGDFRIERVYMLCALAATLLAPGKRWLPNWQHVAHIGFAAAVALCWLASPWADHGELTVENYFKIVVFYFLLVLLVHDEKSLRTLVLGFLVVMFLYMGHSLLEYTRGRHVYRMGISRLIGVDQTLGDPNSFGATVVYALPLVAPFWYCKPSRWLRWFLVAYVGLSTVCVGLTGSRSSLLGLLLWSLVMAWRSKYRWRVLGALVVVVPLLFTLLPESLQTRFETIINPEVGPANAQTSAEGRILGLMTGLELFGRYPLTGVGPGSWKPGAHSQFESHNLYGQLLGEMGFVGALAFLGVLAAYGGNLWQIHKACRCQRQPRQDFCYQLALAIGMAIVFLLFEGNFGHNLFRYSWLWYGGFLIIARHCVDQRGAVLWRPVPAVRPVRRPRLLLRPA